MEEAEMADFPINVKVDPGDSKTKIDDVHRTVEKAEKQATAATRAFTTLGDAIKYTANTTVSSAVRGFGSLNEAIQLEHKWLATIRGDTQGYAKDLTVLNSLLDRGKISVKEYDAALASAGQKHGLADAKPAAGLLDGVVGQVAAIAGPAAIAAKTIGSITTALDDLAQKRRETGEVNAAMLRYTDSLLEARVATEQMRSVSHLLGTDLKTTASAFLDIADASSSLNLSHEKLVDITKSLGSIMKIEGKSIGDVGNVMATLEFAISKGTISSGELARIMKQFPPLAAIWREEFGGTTKQLLDAADSGQLAQLGLDRLLTSIRTTPEVVDKMKMSWHAQNQVVEVSAKFYDQLNQLQELNKLKSSEVTDANRKLIDSWDTTSEKQSLLAAGFDTLTTKATEFWLALQKLSVDPWGDDRTAFAQGIDQITSMIGHAWTEGKKHVDKYKAAVKEAREELKTFAREDEAGLHSSQALEMRGDMFQGKVTNQEWADFAQGQRNQRLAEVSRQRARNAAEWSKWMEHSKHEASEFENILVNAFANSELSFSKMVDSFMADMQRLALRRAALGLGGILFGGDTGNAIGLAREAGFGKGLLGSAGLSLTAPHFAAGGGMRIPGTGATDTTPVTFFATGGEELTVRTPGQQMATREVASAPGSPSAPQPVVVVLDERALLRAQQSPMGAQVLDDLFRKYPGLLKR